MRSLPIIARNRRSVPRPLPARTWDTSRLPTRYFHPGELDALLSLMASVDARVVVEFGVNTGRNAAAALRNLPLERYVGVDVPPGYVPQMAVQRREVPAFPGHLAASDPRFTLILRPRGTFELAPADLPLADLVFIDADHSRAGVENDTALARAIVRPGGLIVWHDDNGLPVVQVTETLNDFCAAGHDIVHIEGTWLSYEICA